MHMHDRAGLEILNALCDIVNYDPSTRYLSEGDEWMLSGVNRHLAAMPFAVRGRVAWASREFKTRVLVAALVAGHHARARLLARLLTNPLVDKGLSVANEQCLRVIIDAGFGTRIISNATMNKTAHAGMLEGVVALRDRGCPWNEWSVTAVASMGNLPMLRYMLNRGCPWNGYFYFAAAKHGHTAIVEYAIDNNFCWSNCEEHILVRDAIKRGHLDVVRCAYERGWLLPSDACDTATESGNLELLKYVLAHGAQWSDSTCSKAATGGHLKILKYAHEKGCAWDWRTTAFAAGTGHLDCLRYAHENGCPWDEGTTMWAALNGHIDCLRYAHENGCPWDEMTPVRAALRRQLECLRYARENGCPWDRKECLEVATVCGHADIIEYCNMHNRGQVR